MYRSTIWAQLLQVQQELHQHHQQQPQQLPPTVTVPASAQRVTHALLLQQARAVAAALLEVLLTGHDLQAEPACSDGAPRPPIIALLLPRSLEYVLSSLAALAAGAAFLPLDLHWPLQRLQQVLHSAQPDILLHTSSTTSLAQALTASSVAQHSPPLQDPGSCKLLEFAAASTSGKALLLQQEHDQRQVPHSSAPQPQQHPFNTDVCGPQQEVGEQQHVVVQEQQKRPLPFFCVLFTSGSTGSPLGVLCTEQGFLNRFHWMQQQQQQQHQHQHQHHQQQQQHAAATLPVPLQLGHVVAFKTATSFVDHLWELLAPFLSGANMLLLPHSGAGQVAAAGAVAAAAAAAAAAGVTVGSTLPAAAAAGMEAEPAGWTDLVLQPGLLVPLLTQESVTHLVAVPSVLELWLPHLIQAKGSLKLQQLVSSGEGLTTALAAQLLDALPDGCVLLNLYGSTEVSADVTCQVVTQQLLAACSSSWVSAGTPISRMAVAVLPAGWPETQDPSAAGSSGPAAAAAAKGVKCLQPLPAGEVGEVWVCGAGVAAGYLSSGPPLLLSTHPEHPAVDAATNVATAAVGTEAAAAAAAAAAPVHRSAGRFKVAQLLLPSAQSRQQPEASLGQAGTKQQGAQQQQQQQHHQQQQQQLSVAAGPGWSVDDVAAEPRVWFRMGDLGMLSAEGTLHLTGRCSQQVKVRGVRVDTLEVEHTLQQHPLVAELAVAAWPHPQRPHDNILVAYVVLKPAGHHGLLLQQQQDQRQQQHQKEDEQDSRQMDGAGSSWQQQLQQHAAAQLPAAARPGAYVLMPQLPRSTAGKVLRSQLPPPAGSVPTLLPLLPPPPQQHQWQDGQQQEGQLPGYQPRPQEQAAAVAGEKPCHSEVAVMQAMLAAVPTALAGAGDRSSSGRPTAQQLPMHLEQEHGQQQEQQQQQQQPMPGVGWALEPTQNFFTDWGGDSLAAAAVAAALGVDVRLVFAYPTARGLSAFLRGPAAGSTAAGTAQAGRVDAATGGRTVVGTAVQAGQQGQDPTLPGSPAAKRPKLVQLPAAPAADAAHQQLGPGLGPDSGPGTGPGGVITAAMLAQADAAVVVGPAGRMLSWQLGSSRQAGAHSLAAALPVLGAGLLSAHSSSQQQQLEVSSAQEACVSAGAVPGAQAQEQQPFLLHWRVPMGRCVDAAPLLLALLKAAPGSPGQLQPGSPAAGGASMVPATALAAGATAAAVAAAAEAPSGSGAESRPELLGRSSAAGRSLVGVLAFACSHSGVVKCVNVLTGRQQWAAALPSRADVGMCLSPCATRLAVPAGNGTLYCLNTADGSTVAELDCGVEVRAPPAADPWLGFWWVVNHGKELLVVDPRSVAITNRLSLPAAGSAAVSFGCCEQPSPQASGPQQQSGPRRCAVLGLLDGTLICVAVTHRASAQHSSGSTTTPQPSSSRQEGPQLKLQPPSEQQQESSPHKHSQQQQHQDPLLDLSVLWKVKGTAPIFSSPVIDAHCGLVVSAAVDGVVTGMQLLTGRQVWQVQLGGQVFADLLLLQLEQQPTVQVVAPQPQSHPRPKQQPPSLPQPQGVVSTGSRAAGGRGLVVVATKAGEMVGIDSATGSRVFVSALGGAGFSAAPAPVTDIKQLLHPTASPAHRQGTSHAQESRGQHQLQRACSLQGAGSSRGGQGQEQEVVVCSTDGTLQLVQQQSQLQCPALKPPAAAGSHQQQVGGGAGNGHESSSGGGGQQGMHAGSAGLEECVGVRGPGVVLPGEVFSSPVVLGSWVVLGCRDDYLYCLRWG